MVRASFALVDEGDQWLEQDGVRSVEERVASVRYDDDDDLADDQRNLRALSVRRAPGTHQGGRPEGGRSTEAGGRERGVRALREHVSGVVGGDIRRWRVISGNSDKTKNPRRDGDQSVSDTHDMQR